MGCQPHLAEVIVIQQDEADRLKFWLQRADDGQEAVVDGAVFGDGFGQRDVLDLGSVQYHQAPKLALMDEVDRRQTVASRQHPVVRRWCSAALRVPQVDGARFVPGLLFDLFGKRFADAAEARVAEGIDLRALGRLAADFGQLGAFSDDDDAVLLAVVVVVFGELCRHGRGRWASREPARRALRRQRPR